MRLPALLAVLSVVGFAGLARHPATFAAAPAAVTPVATDQKFPPDQVEYFEKHIRPILSSKCVECHGPKTQEAGLRLDSRSGLLSGMEGHPAAVPGDPGRSALIAVVKYDGDVQMPPDGKLPPEQLAALTNWVKMGLPWPEEAAAAAKAGEAAKPAEATMWSGSIEERIKRAQAQHWAFQPVKRIAPPDSVYNTRAPAEWNRNPVDRFVLTRLAQAGLTPSPPADKRTLLRRAYYDLIGLPPTLAEVEAFESDVSPDAFAKIVDKLLASPQYGERWARHWLDVARYGDTKGYAFTMERRFAFAYTYRDYVIKAFNSDMPYDRFIREQLAADKLPKQENNAAMPAMGFLTCGRQFTGVHDTVDDQIDAVTRGFLGLTLACARCHDHKFDPLSQADYYSLYGIFRSSTAPVELPLLGEPAPSPEYDAFKAELAKLTAERDQFVGEQEARVIDELRSHVSDYLAKVVLDRLDASGSKEKDFLFDAGDPRPTIVRRWRDYLNATKKQPHSVFAAWHAFDALSEADFEKRAPAVLETLQKPAADKKPPVTLNRLVLESLKQKTPKSMLDVAQAYGAVLEKAYADWKSLQDPKSRKAGEPVPQRLADVAAEELRQVLFAAGSPTVLRGEETRQIFDRKVRGQVDERNKKVEALVVTSPGAPSRAMSLVDSDQLYKPFIFIRGDAARRGPEVPRRNLSVLGGDDKKPFADGSGRLGLAEAITDRNNPLTARVMVNRLWLHHFGEGIVDTPADFGFRSDPPSHPELLDWLAATFMEQGWSTKRMHREILLSSAYRQTSEVPEVAAEKSLTSIDPENRLLWRANRRRLDFEALRDAMLAVSGKLDPAIGGRAVELNAEPLSWRRTIYGFVDRLNLDPVFSTFDFASPEVSTPERAVTLVPQQALFGMNHPFVIEQARAICASPEFAQADDDDARTKVLYRRVFDRAPTSKELELTRGFLIAAATAERDAPDRRQVWRYGYGAVDASADDPDRFQELTFFDGKNYQGGKDYPDPRIGHVRLSAVGGHPGRSQEFATIRRWTAPVDGDVEISGTLAHLRDNGDGIRGRIVTGDGRTLGEWKLLNDKAATDVERLSVRAGDVIDFIVDCRAKPTADAFTWAPIVRQLDKPKQGAPLVWSANTDFAAPPPPLLSAWEQCAQALLLTNEFWFVD